MELNEFPPEILLTILQYLPLQSLRAMMLLSRDWRNFISSNSPLIYRNAAFLHRFISNPAVSLVEAKVAHSPTVVNGVDDWYTFCENTYILLVWVIDAGERHQQATTSLHCIESGVVILPRLN